LEVTFANVSEIIAINKFSITIMLSIVQSKNIIHTNSTDTFPN
jgi:hypothetical protein